MHQHKKVDEIEKQLNKDFENIYDWFVDNNQFSLILAKMYT